MIMKRKIANRIAVSTIVADLVILTVVAGMGTVVLVWSLTSYTDYKNQVAFFSSSKAEEISELVVIEHAWFNDTDSNELYDQANLYLRNVGKVALNITEIDINGASVSEYSPPRPILLGLGQLSELTVTMSNEASEGTIVYVEALTERGNTFNAYFRVG
jgi:hypothetical protein